MYTINMKNFVKKAINVSRRSYCLFGSMSIMSLMVATSFFSACSDKDVIVNNELNTQNNGGGLLNGNHNGPGKDITSVVSITGDADLTRTPIRAIDENGNPTRTVTLDDNFLPIQEGSDLTARVFFVKYDKSLIGSDGFLDPDKCKLAVAEVKWNTITKGTGSLQLDAKLQNVTLHWVNERDKPVNINPGEDWRVAGIIGGAYNPSFDPKRNNNSDASYKMYYTYVSFSPNNEEIIKKHNTIDKDGRIQVAVPFATKWEKLRILGRNKIALRYFNFKFLGTLFRVKVHRNTTLLGANAHCYRFVSSQMSASGGFALGNKIASGYNNTGINFDAPSLASTWFWDNTEDETKFFWLNQTEQAAGNNDRSYEFHYIYDSNKLRGNKPNAYDEFYVWGMPYTQTQEKNARLDNMTCITLEKGGAMLGKKHKAKNGTIYYADEWCYGEGGTNEWKHFDMRAQAGKAFDVELQVMYPKFSATENNKPKYPWPNQLERFAKTNSLTNQIGFSDRVYCNSTYYNWGKLEGYTISPQELKVKELSGKQVVSNNYMIPSGEQWEIVFPNVVLGNDFYTQNRDFGYEGNDVVVFERKPYEEIFSLEDDTHYPIDEKREERRADEMKNSDRFWSYYFPNKSIREIYAIRLDAHNEGNPYGRRYRCAYRYRFINMGDFNYRTKDDGRVATFDDLKGEGGNQPARRMVVQSRWIGNAYIPLDSLQSETWWGKASMEEGDFRNVDCYRIFPCIGYNVARRRGMVYGLYLSRTFRNLTGYGNFNDISGTTFADRYVRRFSNNDFGRSFDQAAIRRQIPIMAIIKQDYPETGQDSPKIKNVSGYNQYIIRKWDTDNSWRKNDAAFNKDKFKVSRRR